MSEPNLKARLLDARDFVLARGKPFPDTVFVLGSGLGELTHSMDIEAEIPFATIPHFRTPSVEGHQGRVVIGRLFGRRIAVLQGRLHFYEGVQISETVFPVRVLAACGSDKFVLTNAAGGLHADMVPSELLLVTDHINLMCSNPLIGPNEAFLGPRFPDLTHVYDSALSQIFEKVATELGIRLRQGVYVGLSGPSYETPAEVRMTRMFGGDVVGMSTVPEAIALRHMGKRVVAISCITNLASGVGKASVFNHEEVLANAKKAYPDFSRLLEGWLSRLCEK